MIRELISDALDRCECANRTAERATPADPSSLIKTKHGPSRVLGAPRSQPHISPISAPYTG